MSWLSMAVGPSAWCDTMRQLWSPSSFVTLLSFSWSSLLMSSSSDQTIDESEFSLSSLNQFTIAEILIDESAFSPLLWQSWFVIALLAICACSHCFHAIRHSSFLAKCLRELFSLKEQMKQLSTIHNFEIVLFHKKTNQKGGDDQWQCQMECCKRWSKRWTHSGGPAHFCSRNGESCHSSHAHKWQWSQWMWLQKQWQFLTCTCQNQQLINFSCESCIIILSVSPHAHARSVTLHARWSFKMMTSILCQLQNCSDKLPQK